MLSRSTNSGDSVSRKHWVYACVHSLCITRHIIAIYVELGVSSWHSQTVLRRRRRRRHSTYPNFVSYLFIHFRTSSITIQYPLILYPETRCDGGVPTAVAQRQMNILKTCIRNVLNVFRFLLIFIFFLLLHGSTVRPTVRPSVRSTNKRTKWNNILYYH